MNTKEKITEEYRNMKTIENILDKIRNKVYQGKELNAIEHNFITSRLELLVNKNEHLNRSWNIKISSLMHKFKSRPDSDENATIYFSLLAEIKHGANHDWIAEELEGAYIRYLINETSTEEYYTLWFSKTLSISADLENQNLMLLDNITGEVHLKGFNLNELPIFKQVQEQLHTKQYKKQLKRETRALYA